MRRGRFIRLTPEEEHTLREAYQRGPKYEFRIKCLCLLMSHQRHSIGELSAYFGVTRHTIYNWFGAWQESGLAGLYRQPGQGRHKATAEVSSHLPLYTRTTAVLFEEANAVFSAYNRPDIPLLIRQQAYGEHPATEFISTWRLSEADYGEALSTGKLYLRLLGPLPYAGLIRLTIWDAKPIPFLQQNVGLGNVDFMGIPAWVAPYSVNGQKVPSILSVWQLSEMGLETISLSRSVVLSMVGQWVDCELSATSPF